jgi:hypothetical protein
MADNEEKKEKTGLIELESLKDLIHIIMHTPFQIINHLELLKKHYYFLVTGGFPGISQLIYYYCQTAPIKGSFVIYNNLQDTYEFGDKVETRGGITFLPIINIKKQNILTIEDFTL